MKLNGLEQYFKTNENGEIVDFTQVVKYSYNPLMYALYYNKSKNLNLNPEQLDYLIQNSDLKQVNKSGDNALMLALFCNKSQNLNLTHEQFDYFIYNSKLKQVNDYGYNALRFALYFNQPQNLNLTKAQWKHLIEHSDVSLITEKEQIFELKKIQAELLHDEILNKIEMNEKVNVNNNKKLKI